MEESLRYFGGRVDALIKGSNLTREEASFLFKQILKTSSPICSRVHSWPP